MSRLYGLFADLTDRAVLVVGGGEVAERKVAALLEAAADVTVGAPELTSQLETSRDDGRIRHITGSFAESWLDNCWLVIAATNDRALNQRIAAAAHARRMFINVVDDLELCTFHVPAIVDRGPLQIAISTAGAAPALGRKLRADIESRLDESLGTMVSLLSRFRDRIKTALPNMTTRRRFYDRLPDSIVATHLRQQDLPAAEAALQAQLDNPQIPTTGYVTLVGAGPGDPGLLTLAGQRALQSADIILHDRLVSIEVLALARRDAECIEVGKKPGQHHFTQARINAMLVQYAKTGLHVVRLKGGDPFIFGRGGEELEYLRAHDIAYAVVPGITAASACAAYAGIPLTHRQHAQSVRFVTAHCQDATDTLDWSALAQERQTLAIYMGTSRLARLQKTLIAHGRAPTTPFALIEKGSRNEQRVIAGRLDELADLAEQHRVASPALLILGEVAALGRQLAWYGDPVLPVAKNPPRMTTADSRLSA